MFFTANLFTLALVTVANAQAVKIQAPGYPRSWSITDHVVPNDATAKITIVVREQGIAEIRKIALAVSDPTSPTYGEYLTQPQLDEIVRPAAADMETVFQWLKEIPSKYISTRGVSNVDVEAPVTVLSKLLQTEFHIVRNVAESKYMYRAGDYTLPAAANAAIATIFGMHGLPLPASANVVQPGQPASVDPSVIYSTYKVTKQTVRRSPTNRQAVAEFQGQFMNSTDLKALFAKYVTDYKEGVDDVITKHVGEYQESSGGVEAELDIQYIMGVSPGIQTEFWEFPGQDFGADLNMWSSNLTSNADVPIVHSVSYGWQGNLSQINVKQSDVDVVDANFAKLAAKGISIMISSGDSGSGYASDDSTCEGKNGGGTAGVGIDGTVIKTQQVEEVGECCEMNEQMKGKGWTFVPHPKSNEPVEMHLHQATTQEKAQQQQQAGKNVTGYTFNNKEFHVANVPPGSVFTERNLWYLNGKVDFSSGGKVAAKSPNTTGTKSLTFTTCKTTKGEPFISCAVTATFGSKKLKGQAIFLDDPDHMAPECFDIEWGVNGVWEQGPNPPPPPPPGTCTVYSSITKKTSTSSSTYSGFPAAGPTAPPLWASWPASSPWVTAVGATRFVGQKVGNAEMATDQFGSGGGFSKMFNQDDAKWQSAAVAKYLSSVDQTTLPPAASYNPMGRATPDVAALGEGYQVFVGGTVEPVGGTSASSPAFAGLVSLINEARMTAGKAAMGFLNPFLYQNEDAFTDITLGSNKIGRGGQPLPFGYNCSAGWDPATGLGTPLFDQLLAAAMKV